MALSMEQKLELMKKFPDLRFKADQQFEFIADSEEELNFLLEVTRHIMIFVRMVEDGTITVQEACELGYVLGLARGVVERLNEETAALAEQVARELG